MYSNDITYVHEAIPKLKYKWRKSRKLLAVLGSQGCGNKGLQTERLTTIEMYSLTVPEATVGSQGVGRAVLPLKALGETPSSPLLGLGALPCLASDSKSNPPLPPSSHDHVSVWAPSTAY